MVKNKTKRACQVCGKPFCGYSNSRYCEECKTGKGKKKRRIITPGETYGLIEVISSTGGKHPRYTCRCQKCGSVFPASGQTVVKRSLTGCFTCAKKESDRKRVESYKEYVGKLYGELEVVEYAGNKPAKKNGDAIPHMRCRCRICGNIIEIPLARLKNGGASKCRECAKKSLQNGREFVRKIAIDGTLITAIDGRRKVNKNSSTSHTGVSMNRESGKYRAYINFKRKQYYLGTYDKIEDAITAREKAEENIYGDFLEWYAKEHPQEWEKLRKNMQE